MRLAAEVCSVLALSAIKNNDKVGFIAFTDKIEKFIPARKGLRHVLRIISEALYFKPKGKGTDINAALEYLNKITTRKTVTFIISDFYAADFKKMLAVSNKRHDIVAITVTDPREMELSDAGIVKLEDLETGSTFMVDTSDRSVRKEYAEAAHKRHEERGMLFRSIQVDNIDIRTDMPYAQSLFRFFRARESRLRIR
jgi:Uncharacterized conserved protein (some members contain a von Willebrand factor type A (vWA) domain)